MAQQASYGGAAQTGQRPLTFESIVKIAIVAAIVVQALDFAVIILRNVIRDNANNLDFVAIFRGQLTDIISQGALFGAVVAAYLGTTGKDMLLRLGAVVLAASVVEDILDNVLVSALNDFSPSLDIVIVLVNSLFLVTTFLGFVMALRLFQGQTILPGVNYRL